MKLLIVTQVVDAEDPVLGFFVGWIAELAQRSERIEVICLKEGQYELPANVRVHSLGKERGVASRFAYAGHFLSLVWRFRHEYDAVFVHMNQEYILIAGWLWKLLGKRIYLWRNHYAGSWLTDVAATFCANVFCTSKYSYTANYAKTVIMPVGVDTDLFKARGERVPRSVLFLARMAPSKRPDVLIEALGILHGKGIVFSASLYGSPAPADVRYHQSLKTRVEELGLSSEVHFYPGPRGDENQSLYPAYDLSVNASPSGMYDKTIFEAAACGCLPVTSNQNLTGTIDPKLIFAEADAANLAEKLTALLEMSEEEKTTLRTQVRALAVEHSLALLGEKLFGVMR